MPSYADMGYSGFVETKDGVFLIYYSGHAYREANLARGNYTTQADVYVSKLKIGKPAARDEKLKRQRKKLAQRRRRIVFNNDGDDIARLGTGAPREELAGEKLKKSDTEYPVTADGFLKVRTKALVGTHVDAIWYYSTWGMNLHHSGGPFGRLSGCVRRRTVDEKLQGPDEVNRQGQPGDHDRVLPEARHGVLLLESNERHTRFVQPGHALPPAAEASGVVSVDARRGQQILVSRRAFLLVGLELRRSRSSRRDRAGAA